MKKIGTVCTWILTIALLIWVTVMSLFVTCYCDWSKSEGWKIKDDMKDKTFVEAIKEYDWFSFEITGYNIYEENMGSEIGDFEKTITNYDESVNELREALINEYPEMTEEEFHEIVDYITMNAILDIC